MIKKEKMPHQNHDLETLKHWKRTSTKSKLEWMEDALIFFGMFKKQRNALKKKPSH